MSDPVFYTEERKAILRRMYLEENCSFSVIAAFFGKTRNSVIGAAHRMGLNKPKKIFTANPTPARRIMAHKVKKAKTAEEVVSRRRLPPPPVLIRGEDLPPLLASVKDLTWNVCAYPYGRGQYRFCGRPRERGAFCRAHAMLCYQDPLDRKRHHANI